MAEREIHWPYKAGYDFEVEGVRLDLYRLLNQFLAEEKLAGQMESDGYLFHAVDIVGHFFDVETQRILINAAVVARVKDDNEEDSRLKVSNFDTTCGLLCEDIEKKTATKPLDLRGACNKILHATRYHYDIEEGPPQTINPTVYLYGTLGKRHWKATIDVIEFVKHYVNNVV